jgi:hypothetical protein
LGLYEEQKTSCDVLLVLIASRERLIVCVFIMIAVLWRGRGYPASDLFRVNTAAALRAEAIGHGTELRGYLTGPNTQQNILSRLKHKSSYESRVLRDDVANY